MVNFLRRLRDGYIKFVEKQGFPIIVTVCVGVITATALWTGGRQEEYVSPTPPVMQDVSAAQLMQQSLRQAATATPAPTKEPIRWQPPLEDATVLRPFHPTTMVQGDASGVWAIHDAVDLKAAQGQKVRAIGDGIVTASGTDRLQGVWLKIDHGDGIEALYAGMALPGTFLPGDDICMAETLGYAGSCMLDETSLGPHLHLRVTQDGASIDPLTLWDASASN